MSVYTPTDVELDIFKIDILVFPTIIDHFNYKRTICYLAESTYKVTNARLFPLVSKLFQYSTIYIIEIITANCCYGHFA